MNTHVGTWYLVDVEYANALFFMLLSTKSHSLSLLLFGYEVIQIRSPFEPPQSLEPLEQKLQRVRRCLILPEDVIRLACVLFGPQRIKSGASCQTSKVRELSGKTPDF